MRQFNIELEKYSGRGPHCHYPSLHPSPPPALPIQIFRKTCFLTHHRPAHRIRVYYLSFRLYLEYPTLRSLQYLLGCHSGPGSDYPRPLHQILQRNPAASRSDTRIQLHEVSLFLNANIVSSTKFACGLGRARASACVPAHTEMHWPS